MLRTGGIIKLRGQPDRLRSVRASVASRRSLRETYTTRHTVRSGKESHRFASASTLVVSQCVYFGTQKAVLVARTRALFAATPADPLSSPSLDGEPGGERGGRNCNKKKRSNVDETWRRRNNTPGTKWQRTETRTRS